MICCEEICCTAPGQRLEAVIRIGSVDAALQPKMWAKRSKAQGCAPLGLRQTHKSSTSQAAATALIHALQRRKTERIRPARGGNRSEFYLFLRKTSNHGLP